MRFAILNQARWSIFAVGMVLAGALPASAQVTIIRPTASLPLIGVPYESPPPGAGCFDLASACVNPGAFTQTGVVSSGIVGSSQEIEAKVDYNATLTPPMGSTIIGSVALTGTVDYTVLGRSTLTEPGSFEIDVTGLSLSGALSLPGSLLDGKTLMVTLDGSNTSDGMTTITPDGGVFQITSFFDVFVDISLDIPTSPSTSVGPIRLDAVPEPSTWTMMLLGFAGLAFAACRRAQAAGSAV
jgi:hypothetical protein